MNKLKRAIIINARKMGERLSAKEFRIIKDSYVSKSTLTPKKTHFRRKWMRPGYHIRIQKKWNKRFGFSGSSCPLIFLNNEIHVHPDNFETILNAFNEEVSKNA